MKFDVCHQLSYCITLQKSALVLNKFCVSIIWLMLPQILRLMLYFCTECNAINFSEILFIIWHKPFKAINFPKVIFFNAAEVSCRH